MKRVVLLTLIAVLYLLLFVVPSAIEYTQDNTSPRTSPERPVVMTLNEVNAPQDTWVLVAHRKERIEGLPDPEPVVHVESPQPTVWDALAECESHGNWSIDTGNGYRGGLQWNQRTWMAVKPADAPDNPAMATRTQEIAAADTLMSEPWGGYQHWPACSKKIGLR